ncbi:hypothetical protein DSO57_1018104 [Entomophthora muscae]|uniref:Uncharacterized protein n=1 Tax=Entomophthora muscae TaxID=34485 RepID=A0ACC2TSV8_9FUNG|nr:hypothetical protein DSO57_1018104 [Entomophthora muscae]
MPTNTRKHPLYPYNINGNISAGHIMSDGYTMPKACARIIQHCHTLNPTSIPPTSDLASTKYTGSKRSFGKNKEDVLNWPDNWQPNFALATSPTGFGGVQEASCYESNMFEAPGVRNDNLDAPKSQNTEPESNPGQNPSQTARLIGWERNNPLLINEVAASPPGPENLAVPQDSSSEPPVQDARNFPEVLLRVWMYKYSNYCHHT